MRSWQRLTLGCALAAILAGALAPGAEAREKWGPFRGQIVDVETGQPIPGAVVLVVWLEVYGIFGNHRFAEAREAVTDAEGRFEIPRLTGLGWKLGIQPPIIDWFAPGYVHAVTVVTPITGEKFVDPTVLKMRRLRTREELRRKSRSIPAFVPPQKAVEYIRATNVEAEMLGLPLVPIPPSGGTGQ